MFLGLAKESVVKLSGTVRKRDEETFNTFLNYHMTTCERNELLGSSSHVLDIVKKHKN